MVHAKSVGDHRSNRHFPHGPSPERDRAVPWARREVAILRLIAGAGLAGNEVRERLWRLDRGPPIVGRGRPLNRAMGADMGRHVKIRQRIVHHALPADTAYAYHLASKRDVGPMARQRPESFTVGSCRRTSIAAASVARPWIWA